MKEQIIGFKKRIAALAVFMLLAAALLSSSMAMAAVHSFSFTAKTLPNGQLGYASGSDAEAVIPGPALFVKQGDTVQVTLTNTTAVDVGFNVPGLVMNHSAKAKPGETKSYTLRANKTGTYVYRGNDNGKELLGLFGALIVDKRNGPVDSFVDDNGSIVPVTQADLDKQFVLFMVGSTFWGTEISADGVQKPLWAAPDLGAVENDLVRFHVLSVGPGHTFHLHAHRWLKTDTTTVIDTKLLSDGTDTHSFTIKAGSGVGPGDWQFHCHLIAHMEAGMHGSFRVDPVGGDGHSIVGASPYGNILLGARPSEPGLVTLEVSDEPASWFRSPRGDAIVGLPFDIKTKSLEVIYPGSSVNFIMSDTNGVHTISTLLWPTGAHHMPFDQSSAYRGGGIVKLTTPGLYVFTCKVHPYMFGAVIVDDPETDGLDLGNPAMDYKIDLVTGISGLPTSSDLAVRLLKTFFIATSPANWQDYSTGVWNVRFPNLPVRISGLPYGGITDGGIAAPLSDNSLQLNIYNAPLPMPGSIETPHPRIPGVGEVWINTQFEKTAGKYKPGTTTVVDTANWTVKRKVALPEINNNNPHNMWPSRDQSVIYQTQWFDTKLSMIDRETGALIKNIRVGDTPSHVVTLPTNDDLTIAINGENGIAIIPAGTTNVSKMLPTQAHGHTSANPHGHWVSADGTKIVTPNINTNDIGVYGSSGGILARTPTGNNAPGAHPIAIGMMPDSSKIYAANLLHHSLSVLDGATGALLKTINLIADYNPIDGSFADNDGNGMIAVGVLPIQTPVSPDGKAVVIASTGGQIVIVDTKTDKIVAMLPCDPGCHGANFGAKQGGGYYAYVTTKFGNRLTVVDVDPDGNGDLSKAKIAGYVSLVDTASTAKDDTVSGLPGFGGQGVLAVPNVYNGWVQNLPDEWKAGLTAAQRNPVGTGD